MWVKIEPNQHELVLLHKWQKYISKLSKIPGIEMIAIVNSLSMYATHEDSDIDLFIVTRPGMIWFVRFFATLTLSMHWVWRRDRDIAGNLCLSFFITTDAMDLSDIAIENDIYLYYWIYYMQPIIDKNETYEMFLSANSWVDVDEGRKKENQIYLIPNCFKAVNSVGFGGRNCLSQIESNTEKAKWASAPSQSVGSTLGVFSPPNAFDTFGTKSMENSIWKESLYKKLNNLIRHFLLPRTLRSYERIWKPEWVIISDQMLKFHDRDRRNEIRDSLI